MLMFSGIRRDIGDLSVAIKVLQREDRRQDDRIDYALVRIAAVEKRLDRLLDYLGLVDKHYDATNVLEKKDETDMG